MKYLLDTHVLIWALSEPDRLKRSIRNIMDSADTMLYFSAISFYEIQIKRKLGKLSFDYDLNKLVDDGIVLSLPVTHKHSNLTFDLPAIHSDPFDRLLIAQSQIEELPLITADQHIQQYDLIFIPA